MAVSKEPQGAVLCCSLHRSSETFWTTTGMFPQEFIIGFPKRVTVSKVAIQCYLGKGSWSSKWLTFRAHVCSAIPPQSAVLLLNSHI